MKYRFASWLLCALPISAVVAPGCTYEPPTVTPTGAGGNGQGGEAQGGGGSGGMAGAGGGMGGAGGGCTTGTTEFCSYSGHESTKDVGSCRASVKTCKSGKWTECSAEILPALEACDLGADRNCDMVTGCKGNPVKASVTMTPTTADDIIAAMATGKGASGLDGVTYAVGGRGGNFAAGTLNGWNILMLKRGPMGAVTDLSGEFKFTPSAAGIRGAIATDVAVIPSTGQIAVVGVYAGGTLEIGQTTLGTTGGARSFLAIFNSADTLSSAIELGAGGELELFAVDADNAGNIYIGGNYSGSPKFYGQTLPVTADRDGIFASVKPGGTLNWRQLINVIGYQSVKHITMVAGTDPVAAVEFNGTLAVTNSQGQTETFNAGMVPDFAIVRHTATDGGIQWAEQIPCSLDLNIGGIAASATQVAVTGSFTGTLTLNESAITANQLDPGDAFLAAFDASNGGFKNRALFMGPGKQEALGVAIDGLGDFVVSGAFSETLPLSSGALTTSSSNDFDAFVVKFDPGLLSRWAQRFGDANYQTARAVTVGDTRGHIFIGGGFAGSLNGIVPTPISTGAMDAFILETTN